MIGYLLWGALLFLQQATHTASSRAKNSSSLMYGAVSGACSHSVWYLSTFFIVAHQQKAQGDPMHLFATCVYYVLCCVAGGVAAQAWLIRYERKKGIARD